MLSPWHLRDKYSSKTPLKLFCERYIPAKADHLNRWSVPADKSGEGVAGGGSIAMYIHQLPSEKIVPQRTSEAILIPASA